MIAFLSGIKRRIDNRYVNETPLCNNLSGCSENLHVIRKGNLWL
ncbi:protein of unknown function [Candidatus Nitrosocosmicus franklandus]|uniref:Uncharacterized protein n=1 Tax=Candidatus Nitrosocosmicus franklandianus TaxID=1798806 RepID=A0A484I8V7_9ARCH|nr:protein of unknown function [Candidatus Nitrosocosmicus franklandus]